MPLIKLNKILVRCHLFHKKLRLQSLQVSSSFKFNVIFTLVPCGETLLITNSIHVSLIPNLLTRAQPLFTCSNTSQQLHGNVRTS